MNRFQVENNKLKDTKNNTTLDIITSCKLLNKFHNENQEIINRIDTCINFYEDLFNEIGEYKVSYSSYILYNHIILDLKYLKKGEIIKK